MRIHLIAHSHIDPAWTWDKYEGIDEVLNTFRAACDRLDAYPDVCFSASSLLFYEWALEHDPAVFKRIQKHVRRGKWEIVGGWWIEADSNLPSAESLIRQAELSQAFAKKHFGKTIQVAFLPDSFGHPATLPLILKKTGFKYFMFCRPSRAEKADLPSDLFYWKYGNARVLTYRAKHFYGNHAGWTPDTYRPKMDDPEYTPDRTNCVMFGMGDHGGAMTIREIEFSKEYITSKPDGDTAFSTMLAFFQEAVGQKSIPEYEGDLHFHAIGCYAAVRDIKQGVRSSEQLLGQAERALAMTGAKKAAIQSALLPQWKTVLFNQFHDILPGSCVRATARHATDELGAVSHAAREIIYGAIKSISLRKRVTFKEGEFRVFNTLPFPVTMPLSLESLVYFKPGATFRQNPSGQPLPIQEVVPESRAFTHRWEFVDSLPARGFKRYYFDGGSIIGDVTRYNFPRFEKGSQAELEGTHLSADGAMHILGQPLFKQAPRFLIIRDTSDLWGHNVRQYRDVDAEFALTESSILSGPVTAKLHLQYRCKKSSLSVIYSVYSGVPGIFASVDVRWAEDCAILKMELSPCVVDPQAIAMQAAAGVVRRQADGMEQPLHNWIWMPGSEQRGMTVIQDGAFACDSMDSVTRVTLVRSNIYSNHDPYTLHSEDPQRYTDQGVHSFRFWFLPDQPFNSREIDRRTAAFLETYPVVREGWRKA